MRMVSCVIWVVSTIFLTSLYIPFAPTYCTTSLARMVSAHQEKQALLCSFNHALRTPLVAEALLRRLTVLLVLARRLGAGLVALSALI